MLAPCRDPWACCGLGAEGEGGDLHAKTEQDRVVAVITEGSRSNTTQSQRTLTQSRDEAKVQELLHLCQPQDILTKEMGNEMNRSAVVTQDHHPGEKFLQRPLTITSLQQDHCHTGYCSYSLWSEHASARLPLVLTLSHVLPAIAVPWALGCLPCCPGWGLWPHPVTTCVPLLLTSTFRGRGHTWQDSQDSSMTT